MESNSTPADGVSPSAEQAAPSGKQASQESDAANAALVPIAGSDANSRPTRRQGSKLEACALWLLGSTLAAAGIGCAAGLLQVQRIAPVGLLPVAVGVGVAMAAERLGHTLGLRVGRAWIAAAITWALLAIVAEVYIGHRDHLRDLKDFENSNPKAALFADEQGADGAMGLWHYFRGRFDQTPILISVDALLTVVAAAAWMEYRRRLSRRPVDSMTHS